MDARPVVRVVCALLEDSRGRLLLARRPPGKHLAGLWEFPGGKIEAGESAEAALHRELFEELGCRVEIGTMLTPVTHAYERITVTLLPLLARLAEGSSEPYPREHDALRWVDAEELSRLALPEADAPIVAEWKERRAAGGATATG